MTLNKKSIIKTLLSKMFLRYKIEINQAWCFHFKLNSVALTLYWIIAKESSYRTKIKVLSMILNYVVKKLG